MLKIFFTIIILFGSAQSFASFYCLSDDFLAFQSPDWTYPTNNQKSIPWIVFHVDMMDPTRSSVEKLSVPEIYCTNCNKLPELLDVVCSPKHLRFAIGTPKHSQQFIYELSDGETKFVTKEVLKTFNKMPLKELTYSVPMYIKLKNGSFFKIEQIETNVRIGKDGVRSERKITASLISTDNKSLRHWDLWKKSFEKTID